MLKTRLELLPQSYECSNRSPKMQVNRKQFTRANIFPLTPWYQAVPGTRVHTGHNNKGSTGCFNWSCFQPDPSPTASHFKTGCQHPSGNDRRAAAGRCWCIVAWITIYQSNQFNVTSCHIVCKQSVRHYLSSGVNGNREIHSWISPTQLTLGTTALRIYSYGDISNIYYCRNIFCKAAPS